jgi:hypothetical protein
MSAWLSRQLQVQLPDISGGELAEFDLDDVQDELQSIACQFHPSLPMIDCGDQLQPIPTPKSLDPKFSPRLYNSAVIGYFKVAKRSYSR